MYSVYDLIILGGGAAGIFAALSAKTLRPHASVLVLEKTAHLLTKVKISGGGRCNVTTSVFDPKELVKNYPRGHKELLGPFHHFGPRETVEWFSSRQVALKVEADGRIFPTTDSSQTIIETLLSEAKKLHVEIATRQHVESIEKQEEHFIVTCKEGKILHSHRLLLATGSSREGYALAKQFGHTVIDPVPSLFTFHVPTSPLKELSGVAIEDVAVSLYGTSFFQRGPLLITHFGFSGPAILKLSAWAARYLHETGYKAELLINWLPKYTQDEVVEMLVKRLPLGLPKNLWKTLSEKENSPKSLAAKVLQDSYLVDGKTMHKEEFVTCGGVDLKELHSKTFESKLCKGLFFAGEILNIDGVTGGFNFQNAWTTGFLAGTA